MKTRPAPRASGFALIIVMVIIFVLGILAGLFAYSMKVEMRLAMNHNHEAELEWIGRSGVELARYILAQEMVSPSQPYDALNQKWAGGSGGTNESLREISMENNPLGSGSFSIKIIDQERKFNINTADKPLLQQAMNLVGLDAAESSSIVESILDWRDPDNESRLSGAESDYYQGLNPPYNAKNGPIDDLSELLLVRGITPEMYYGPNGANPASGSLPVVNLVRRPGDRDQPQVQVGLVDLFAPLSGRQVNINTASGPVLQLISAIDPTIAQNILQMRAGPDGVEGNEDDTPFRNVGELVNVPGIGPQMAGLMARYFTVRSGTFEVQVEARIGKYRRQYIALLRRNNPRDIQILYFYWK